MAQTYEWTVEAIDVANVKRKWHLGGSAANQISQGNAYDVWQRATGRLADEDLTDNIAVQLGIFTEPFNIKWFEKESGLTVTPNVELHHNEYPYFVAHLDGVIKESGNTPLECKHTSSYNHAIADYYYGQLQFYIWMADAEEAHLSVIHGNTYRRQRVARDEAFLDPLIDAMHYVARCIEEDRPPSERPIAVEPTNVVLDDMRVVDMSANNEWGSEAAEWTQMQPFKKRFDTAQRHLKAIVPQDAREAYGNGVRITRAKNNSLTVRMDNKYTEEDE